MKQRMKVGKITNSENGWSVELNSVDVQDERTFKGYACLHMSKEEATALEIGQIVEFEVELAPAAMVDTEVAA